MDSGIHLKFYWDGENGHAVKGQLKRLMETAEESPGHWVTVADFLQDVIYEANKAYNRVVEHGPVQADDA